MRQIPYFHPSHEAFLFSRMWVFLLAWGEYIRKSEKSNLSHFPLIAVSLTKRKIHSARHREECGDVAIQEIKRNPHICWIASQARNDENQSRKEKSTLLCHSHAPLWTGPELVSGSRIEDTEYISAWRGTISRNSSKEKSTKEGRADLTMYDYRR